MTAMDVADNTLRRFAGPTDRLPMNRCLSIALSLARQARNKHEEARWHGDIRLETVELNSRSDVRLKEPIGARVFGGDHCDLDICPPELAGDTSVRLPLDLREATQRLRQSGVNCDVRRIDVYQIGVVLCQLLTGESVRQYAESARLKGTVPPEARDVLDRTLGFDSTERVQTCNALCDLLEAAQNRLTAIDAPHAETPVNRKVSPDTNFNRPDAIAGENILPCERVAHFRLLKLIGRGGMGEVYLAHDEKLDRLVAVKILRQELANDDSFIGRFQTEVDAIKQLPHPNLLPLYYSGTEDGRRFYVMRFVEGPSLATRLRTAPLKLEEAIDIALQCLSALAVAHDEKLIHRDIKPGNVLLETATGRAYLVDFGLARRVDDSHGLTRTGVVVGSFQYLSPEQARGDRQIDHRADLYSFGVMFYQMLAGQLPFSADSEVGWIFQHVNEPPVPLATSSPHLPPELCALINDLLAKKPENRPANCRAVIERLQPLQKPAARASQFASELSSILEHERQIAAPTLILPPTGVRGAWQRLQDGAATIIRRRTPAWVERCQTDEQQVDATIAQYERRRRRLQVLQVEGHRLLRDLREQAKIFENALNVEARDSLHAQISDMKEQVVSLDLQVAQVSAAVLQLVGTRDALQARLKQAQPAWRRRNQLAMFGSAGAAVLTAFALTCAPAIWGILFGGATPGQQSVTAPATYPVANWHQFLPDADRDRVFGKIEAVSDGIRFSPEGRTLMTLPGDLPAQYDLELEFSKVGAGEGIAVLIPVGEYACCAYFGGYGNRHHGLFLLRGNYEAADSRTTGSVPAGPRQKAMVQVRVERDVATIALFLNGKKAFAWKGDPIDLALSYEFRSAEPRAAAVTTFESDITLHAARWRESTKPIDTVTGESDLVRDRQEFSPANDSAGIQEQAATAVLAIKGKLRVVTNGIKIEIDNPAVLPKSSYEIIAVDLEHCQFVDLSLITLLGRLKSLQEVELLSTGVDDIELAPLKNLPNLRVLGCGDSPAAGSFLAGFDRLPSLELISFGGKFQGENLDHFAKFPNLVHVYLCWTQLADEDLKRLPPLERVRHVLLDHTNITGEGLQHLARWPAINDLQLDKTKLTDEGLTHLPRSLNLTKLSLTENSIGDASVEHLKNFTSLRTLNMRQTNLTPAGLAELRAALPDCTIEHD